MSGLQVLLVVIAVIGGIFAIRLSLSFDLNQWIRERPLRRLHRAQRRCPHIETFDEVDEEGRISSVEVRSLFAQPPGSTTWICAQCGAEALQHQVVLGHRRATEEIRRKTIRAGQKTGLNPRASEVTTEFLDHDPNLSG